MSDADWRDQLPPTVRVTQIIIAALFLGSFNFLIIAALVVRKPLNAADQSFMDCIALAFSFVTLGIWAFLPGIVVSRGRKRINQQLSIADEQQTEQPASNPTDRENTAGNLLLGLFTTKTIIAGALLEGTIFFLLIAFLSDKSLSCLILAIAIMIRLVTLIPTIGRTTNWVEKQLRLLSEERDLG
jgi:hypothetical protein